MMEAKKMTQDISLANSQFPREAGTLQRAQDPVGSGPTPLSSSCRLGSCSG